MVKLFHIQSIESIYTAFEDERTINSLTKNKKKGQWLATSFHVHTRTINVLEATKGCKHSNSNVERKLEEEEKSKT